MLERYRLCSSVELYEPAWFLLLLQVRFSGFLFVVTCLRSSCVCSCRCPLGFTGNPYVSCVDIDECALGYCSPNANCDNSIGSFNCSCKAGFAGDGLTCTDINECSYNNGGCSSLAPCENTPGSVFSDI
jgi:hypothetical protein